eukprot:g1120.t1
MDGPYSNSRGQSFDYSADNGYVRAQTQRRGFRGTEENAKTKLCMRWLAGDCRFGSRCNFAHGSHELRKIPPKPGRYSQDTRDGRLDKDEQLSCYAPYTGYHSVSFDTAYRNFEGQSNVYHDNYHGNPFNRTPGSYPGQMFDPPSINPSGFSGANPAPGMVQNSGPIHISAATAHGANGGTTSGTGGGGGAGSGEYYNTDPGFSQDGPNGWTMYRDPKSGEPYYHNHNSGITQWKCPDEWSMH